MLCAWFSAGELIFSKGELCTGLYVVKPALADANSGQTDGPGGSVAELAVFDGVNYLAAQAITDCSLSFLSKKDS